MRLLPQRSPRNLRLWVLFAVLVAVMQFSDPLGDVSLSDATLFWVGRLAALSISLMLAEWFLGSFFVARWRSPEWLKPAILSMVLASVPMTLVEVGLESWVPQDAAYDDSELRDRSFLLALLGEYLTILSVVLPINVLLWVLIDRGVGTESPAPVSEPPFLAKVGGVSAADVIALQAEEHYVRVWTEVGSDLVYSRLSDAIEQMPPALGLQVHRSWWVAERAVLGGRRGQRRYRLELSNGMEVPVSDRFLSQVRERGLLHPVRREA